MALPLCVWLVGMVGAGFVVARGQSEERQRHIELFESRADSGAEFVATYLEVFNAVFAGAYNSSEGPLGVFLERQPVEGTFGVLVDSRGQEIMAAGDNSSLARSLLDELKASSHEPIVTGDRVVVSAPVEGTSWTYILDAPKAELLAAATANDRSEWLLLGTLGVIILGAIVANLRAIAARESARQEKEQVDRRLRLTVENAPVGMALVGLDLRFMEPNRRLCEMLGYSAAELTRLTAHEVTHPDDLGHGEEQLQLLRSGEIDHVELEKRYVRADGSLLWGRLSSSVVRDEDGAPAYFVNQVEDVTEVRKARAELQHRALYDPLTGLANRSLLMDRLTQALSSDRHHASVGVGYCDLDHFKSINDTHGHGVGDEILKAVGYRLHQSVRAEDTVARLGGDEFVILLHDAQSAEEAKAVMDRARRAIQEPIVVGDLTIKTSLSGGLAIATIGTDPDVLLRDADAALYVAKRAGRGRIEVTDQAPTAEREPHVV